MELDKAEYYDTMNEVVKRLLQGNTNPSAIARELNMKRKDVLDYIDEWKRIASNRPDIQARAMEALTAMDRHYDMLNAEFWGIANTEIDNKIRLQALKHIADIEARRQEALQKAGLFDDAGVGDELAVMEARAEAIKELLSEVAKQFPQTRTMIMEGITRIFNDEETSMPSDDTVIKGEITDA